MKGTEFTVRGEVHINCGEHTGEMDMKSRQRFQLGYLHISNTSSHSHQETNSTALIWTNSGIWDIRNVYI